MSREGGQARSIPKAELALLILLTVSIFINYLDRSNLSVAAPSLQKDLGFSTTQIGLLLSAFFWTYSLLQLLGISGWISDRYPVGIVFGISFFIWAGSTIATGFASSFAVLFALRLLLGAGESMAYPCYSRIFASDIPQHHRGRANALLDAGSKLGPALGTFLGGLLLVRFGWRNFFIVLGVGSVLWLFPWVKWMPRSRGRQVREDSPSHSVRQMLGFRSAWGTFAGHFCGNYFWFFLLIWLPSYLLKERGFSIRKMASIGSISYFAIAAATMSAGWISDRLIKRGASTTAVRKSVVVGGLLGSTVIVPVAFVHNVTLSIALLFASCMAFGTYTSNHWAITQTLAGPEMAGRWTSIQNGIGNFSGIVAAWLTGFIVERTGSFKSAFLVSAGIAAMGALMWGLVVGPVQEVPWSEGYEPTRG